MVGVPEQFHCTGWPLVPALTALLVMIIEIADGEPRAVEFPETRIAVADTAADDTFAVVAMEQALETVELCAKLVCTVSDTQFLALLAAKISSDTFARME